MTNSTLIGPLDVARSFAATLVRPVGLRVGALRARPKQPLHLYDFEGCPFCRKVREALTYLDLEVIVYPCPKQAPTYREQVKLRGGVYQFPYLDDPNTNIQMYESDTIIRYLFDTYGNGRRPLWLSLGILTNLGAALPGLFQGHRGVRYQASRLPVRPLELYGYEGSPYCRLVRETLSSLELPYLLHNVASGSPSRLTFVERSGKMQVPYLFDPNTDIAMFESRDIVAYLEDTYAV